MPVAAPAMDNVELPFEPFFLTPTVVLVVLALEDM